MSAIPNSKPVAVIGAGTMGAGIAQVAAAAGHRVFLYDAAEGAAGAGKARLARGLEALVSRGKMDPAEVGRLIDRIEIASGLEAMSEAALVIEAIVENLDVKRGLFAKLEGIVDSDCILATNTSSISITAIAAGLRHAERVAGMHFFNPAPVMKLVEVVSGLATSRTVADAVHATATAWGKVAVHARSTPGFIVNRVARAFYGEALRLLEEGVANAVTLDALITGGGGFRMGPFDLMDLIGNDVNYAVSKSVFDAFHQEPRFRPSTIQQELVSAGRLGRKSGRGFHDYAEGAVRPAPSTVAAQGGVETWANFALTGASEHDGVHIVQTDGRTARAVSKELGRPVIVHDLLKPAGDDRRLGFAASPDVSAEALSRFAASLAAQGIAATALPDWPGLVVMRTLAAIANEGFETVLQGVAAEAGIDDAMRFGVNYPRGPMQWAREVGLRRIVSVLDTLRDLTGDMRYRASLALRFAAED